MAALFDKTNKLSIFNYSKGLLGHCLREFATEEEISRLSATDKGQLGKMVEYLYFKFPNNGNPEADFIEAGLELKCTGLKTGSKTQYLIKERLVCNMINYCKDWNVRFEDSHFYNKCLVMLLLFYLYKKGADNADLQFLFAALWQLPEKDLQIIREDYYTILSKIKDGKADELSEGDTVYLGACRKGSAGATQGQPFSEKKAKTRAFSLKPTYMRTILYYLTASKQNAVCNFADVNFGEELVSTKELRNNRFENILTNRFVGYYGLNSFDIAKKIKHKAWLGKDKYFDAANAIVGKNKVRNVNLSEEFLKSGFMMKTIRVEKTGRIIESMSFENIDYQEVYDCDSWEESRLYEIFSNRIMFVIFRNTGKKIGNKAYENYLNKKNRQRKKEGKKPLGHESSYVLEDVFFWTMPPKDLEIAKKYWLDIKKKIEEDNIKVGAFWDIKDHRLFHVRPKGKLSKNKDISPVTGQKNADQLCYWFNSDYIKKIVQDHKSEISKVPVCQSVLVNELDTIRKSNKKIIKNSIRIIPAKNSLAESSEIQTNQAPLDLFQAHVEPMQIDVKELLIYKCMGKKIRAKLESLVSESYSLEGAYKYLEVYMKNQFDYAMQRFKERYPGHTIFDKNSKKK